MFILERRGASSNERETRTRRVQKELTKNKREESQDEIQLVVSESLSPHHQAVRVHL